MTFTRRDGLKVFGAGAVGALAGGGVLLHPAAALVPVGTPEPDAEPKDGGEFIIAIAELPDTLDPHKTGAAITSTIMGNCGDRLITKDLDGNFVPHLATEYQISEDGLTWTFTLRQDVTFHDGTPLNAEACKFTFDRILDPNTKAVTAAGLVGPMASTTVVDEFTFQFTLGEPFAPLLQYLTSGNLSIISPTAVQELGDDFGRKPVLSGPWMVDEWRSGEQITLKRNPNYAWAPAHFHQGSPAHIETLNYKLFTEEAARIAAFEAGEVHMSALPAADIQRITDSGDYWIVTYSRKGTTFLAFNITKAPFDDVKVRAGLNQAVNKQDVVDAALEGFGEPAYAFNSPEQGGYWEGMAEYAPAFDVEAAKATLAEAGWTDSDGDGVLDKEGQKLEFTALIFPNDAFSRGAQVVQAQLEDIGATMELQSLEFATVLDEAKAGNHQAVFMGYTYSDPDAAFLLFHSTQIGAGLNLNQVTDPHLDELIMQGRSTMEPAARDEVYAELARYITDQALWVPLWIDHYSVAFNKSLHNAHWSVDNVPLFFDAWID